MTSKQGGQEAPNWTFSLDQLGLEPAPEGDVLAENVALARWIAAVDKAVETALGEANTFSVWRLSRNRGVIEVFAAAQYSQTVVDSHR